MDFMPPDLISRLRPCGRAAVAIATVLMIVQAFFAGLAGAQAAVVLDAGAGDIAVICHGGGGGSPEGGTAPDTPEKQHPCCTFCTAGVGTAVLPTPALALLTGHYSGRRLPALQAVSIQITPRAVRAGSSQAPPASV
jgi:Protein of unknown function (DUF2946)